MTGWASIDAVLESLGLRVGAPTPGQTTAGDHVPNSEHYQGRARDYGDADSDAAGIAKALLPYAQGPNAPIDELFFSPLGIFYKNGQAITPDDGLRQQHYNHVHVGLRSGVDLVAAIAGLGGAKASTVGFPGSGILGGAIGDVLTPVKKAVVTVVFVAAGITLVVMGGVRAGKRVTPSA